MWTALDYFSLIVGLFNLALAFLWYGVLIAEWGKSYADPRKCVIWGTLALGCAFFMFGLLWVKMYLGYL